ncbi:MAG: 4Fe-4S dicluster domain-containing protein [Pseudomonadota bacterium]
MISYSGLESAAGPVAGIRTFLRSVLSRGLAEAVLVAARTPYSNLPMPLLIVDPDKIDLADPLAPAAPFNAARQASKLCRGGVEKKLALVLRPCEIRALVELVKLRQADLENVLLISFDCPGRMENDLFLPQAEKSENLTEDFLKKEELRDLAAPACRICIGFQAPPLADVNIRVYGDVLGASAETAKGEAALAALGLVPGPLPEAFQGRAEELLHKRTAARRERLAATRDRVKDLDGLEKALANCLNCYNCRTACPVCYCRECVFLTDVFAHDPELYFRRAERRGAVKIPTDTTMFHLTRLAHMSHACVGCGQCSSVCPSSIPVADIFMAAAEKTQELFGYNPGQDPDQPIPYLAFDREN